MRIFARPTLKTRQIITGQSCIFFKYNPAPPYGLKQRERDIIAAIVEYCGRAKKTLAKQLFISEHTVRIHLTSADHNLGVTTRLELYVYPIKHQLAGAARGGQQQFLRQPLDAC